MNTLDVQLIPMCGYLRYLQVDFTGVILTDNLENVVALSSKGQIMTSNTLIQGNLTRYFIQTSELCYRSEAKHRWSYWIRDNGYICIPIPVKKKRRQPTSLQTELHYPSSTCHDLITVSKQTQFLSLHDILQTM